MSARNSITQIDVAKLAGVSTASVSRVLNGSTLVKDDVKRRVEQAISSLNYVPHDAARALASRRTRTLGAIIPTLNNAIFAEGINAFEQAARAQGYTLVLSVSNYDLGDERQLIRKMIERGVDGLLLVGNEHLPESFDALEMADVRYLCAWAYSEDGTVPNVGFSNADAMSGLVDLLVDQGHRKFSMLAGVIEGNDRARERVEGVRRRLADHDLDLADDAIIEIPYSIRSARKALPDALSGGATALICGNDVIAFGALLEAQRLGIAVPEALSITGFDNLNLSGELDPPITTINVPAVEMGSQSAEALIGALEEGGEVRSRVLETELLVRGTTGPAPQTRNG